MTLSLATPISSGSDVFGVINADPGQRILQNAFGAVFANVGSTSAANLEGGLLTPPGATSFHFDVPVATGTNFSFLGLIDTNTLLTIAVVRMNGTVTGTFDSPPGPDAVRIDDIILGVAPPIPEPSTSVLLICGVGGLISASSFRRRMNHRIFSTICLALALLPLQLIKAASPSSPNAPAFYPCSESSPFVRVPKSFLDEIELRSVSITNYETMEFVVTEEFAQVFGLAPSEVEQLTAYLKEGLKRTREVRAKHWVSSDVRVDLGQWTPTVKERFAFSLSPHEKESAASREWLREKLVAILGKQRSDYFWDCKGILESETQGFGRDKPDGGTTTYTFLLRQAENGLQIDLNETTIFEHGRSAGAGDYPASLDEYAPESMKPVLARWRKMVAESKATEVDKDEANSGSKARSENTGGRKEQETGMPFSIVTEKQSSPPIKWDDQAPYVDVPKKFIHAFRVAGLTIDDQISPAARTLLGISDSEAKAVTALYIQMEKLFQDLERSHFERTTPTGYSFVLRAFPDQAKAMQAEWLVKLGKIVGADRAKLVDESVRTPIRAVFRHGGIRNINEFSRMDQKGASWLTRGTAETKVELTVDKGPNGEVAIDGIQWKSEGGGSGSASVRPGFGGMRILPQPWRHLITPDTLTMPSIF